MYGFGGEGEPLLLHCGWPQSWYAWRYLMLPLSQHFKVIAVDPRGLGISDKPVDGFDVNTLADNMFKLMDVFGHDRFALVGHDIGVMVGYAKAALHPQRLTRIALGEGTIPGVSLSPDLIPDNRILSDFLWHFNFNRALEVNERLVEFGRLDGAFNNAGVEQAIKPLHEIDEAQWDKVLNIDLKGVFLCMKHEIKAIQAAVPMQRLGQPEEIAQAEGCCPMPPVSSPAWHFPSMAAPWPFDLGRYVSRAGFMLCRDVD